MKRIAIIGFGWLGKPLGIALSQIGYSVVGTVATSEKFFQLGALPVAIARLEINSNEINGDWDLVTKDAEFIVLNFPPGKAKAEYPEKIEQICRNTTADKKVIFISSTSVYGSENRSFSEADSCNPTKESGKFMLQAEQNLRAHFGNNLTILRLAGLIGPNRYPGKFLSGKKDRNPDSPVNLIHQEDAVEIVVKTIENNVLGEILNGCSDQHPKRSSFYLATAKHLGLPEPQFEESENQSWKIIDNQKSKDILGMQYRYPDPMNFFASDRLKPVYIVGAGPGDAAMLTIKAKEILENADVVLHDNLVSQQILDMCHKGKHIYVGRKYGDSSNQDDRQSNINQQLEDYHKQGCLVVRLKSGDPYVFGRAAEEARFLSQKEIPYQVIPGITAGLAAANNWNLPITERRKSSSLLICTAHTADYSFDQLKGIAELLNDGNSLAIYMGLKSLHKLVPKLIEVTGDPNIPINAIANVSRPNEAMLSSTLENIQHDLEDNPLEMPVVFIVGVKPIV